MTYDEFQRKLNARIFGQDLNYEILLALCKIALYKIYITPCALEV